MGRSKRDEDTEIKHVHHFIDDPYDPSQRICIAKYFDIDCTALQVSEVEYIRRKMEWDKYYEKCKKTDSYKRYLEMKEAVKTKNHKKIKEIMEWQKENCNWVENELGEQYPEPMNPVELPKCKDPYNIRNIYEII